MASPSVQSKRRRRSKAAVAALSLVALAGAVTRAAAADAGPAGLYVCVRTVNGERQQTDIALDPGVDKLCRKAPEMGPCQYEREACRRRGGRVYTSTGQEITRETEAEYDRRVMRFRMKSN